MDTIGAVCVSQWSAILRQCQPGPAALHCDAAAAEILRWSLHAQMATAATASLTAGDQVQAG